MSAMDRRKLVLDYAQGDALSTKTTRMAKKLCAPCCWVVREAPTTMYCDAVTVPGEAYCAAHEEQMAANTRRAKKFSFMFAAMSMGLGKRSYS